MDGLLLIIPGLMLLAGAGYVYRQRRQTDDLRAQIAENERVLSALRHDLVERDRAVAEVQQNTAKCDAIILRLRQDLARNEGQTDDYKRQLEQLSTLNNQLQNQLEAIEKDSIQSKALFSTISNISYDLVFVLDEYQTIIAVNSATDVLLGTINPIGDRLGDVIDSEDLLDIVDRAYTESESLEEQIVIAGSYYRVRTQVMRYDETRSFIGVALQDITRLVRLNRARRDMVANISHELSTPIASIRLIIDGLFHEHDRPKRKASIQSLRDIGREVDSLQQLVQELLDLSMIESGQAIMKLIPVRLVDIVDESAERLVDQLAIRDLKLVKHVPERLQVLCDRDQTRRVIMNLIRNAIKWSPQGDSITVSATAEGEDVVISVFDNGPGVPEDQRQRIFERFYQVDTARTKGEGSGLGLAISKHIVEAHGGRIWAEGNSRGSGGRFLFSLLNADAPDDDEIAEMDRGQHDFPYQTSLNTEHGDTETPPDTHPINDEQAV